MMRFDPFNWQEVQSNVELKAPQGLLELRASARGALFITSQGYEALAGCGEEFSVTTEGEVTFRFETAVKGARVFILAPPAPVHRPEAEETFTNADRMVHESGAVLAVKAAMREFELQRRATLSQMRAERDEIERARQAVEPKPKPKLKAEPTAKAEAALAGGIAQEVAPDGGDSVRPAE